ncbi:MAG: SGNH/GDSL hydrolase family protein [Planctomycetes bacterium]|nr:SGNH/GDSL hydrolase family protein [Planctomycetota bacterium]
MTQAQEQRSRPGRRLKKALLLLGAIAVALALAEGAMRLSSVRAIPFPENTGAVTRPADDPLLQRVPRPNATQTITYRLRRDASPVVVTMNTNRHGFRGRAFAEEKPEGTFRIACVGDSYTFGMGVGDDETWPARLQALVDLRAGAGRCEVWNCGVPAYDTPQELAFLTKTVLPFRPDLVLLCYYLNDAKTTEEIYRSDNPLERLLEMLSQPRREGFRAFVRRHSVLADVLAEQLFFRLAMDRYAFSYLEVYRADLEGWREAKQALVRMRDLLREQGIRFGVITYPLLIRREGALESSAADAIVHEFLRQESIAAFDLAPSFHDRDVDALRVHPYDPHPNAAAHQIAAEAVAGFVERVFPEALASPSGR